MFDLQWIGPFCRVNYSTPPAKAQHYELGLCNLSTLKPFLPQCTHHKLCHVTLCDVAHRLYRGIHPQQPHIDVKAYLQSKTCASGEVCSISFAWNFTVSKLAVVNPIFLLFLFIAEMQKTLKFPFNHL